MSQIPLYTTERQPLGDVSDFRFVSLINGTRGPWRSSRAEAEQDGERHGQAIARIHPSLRGGDANVRGLRPRRNVAPGPGEEGVQDSPGPEIPHLSTYGSWISKRGAVALMAAYCREEISTGKLAELLSMSIEDLYDLRLAVQGPVGPDPKGSPGPELTPLAWCPQCGPQIAYDEDGCCLDCGADATGDGSREALSLLARLKKAEREAQRQYDEAVALHVELTRLRDPAAWKVEVTEEAERAAIREWSRMATSTLGAEGVFRGLMKAAIPRLAMVPKGEHE